MTFTVVIDVDTKSDATQPIDVRSELLRLLTATTRGWKFIVWPAEETERDA